MMKKLLKIQRCLYQDMWTYEDLIKIHLANKQYASAGEVQHGAKLYRDILDGLEDMFELKPVGRNPDVKFKKLPPIKQTKKS